MIDRNAKHAELLRLVGLDPRSTTKDYEVARRSASAAAAVLEVHGYAMSKVTPGMQEDELGQSDEEDRRILEAEAKGIPARIKQLAVRLARLKRILASGAPFVAKGDDDSPARVMASADDLIEEYSADQCAEGETPEASLSRLVHSGDAVLKVLVEARDGAYGLMLEATVPAPVRLAKDKGRLAKDGIENQIERLAKARAERDGCSQPEGYARLMETAEGADLYRLLTLSE